MTELIWRTGSAVALVAVLWATACGDVAGQAIVMLVDGEPSAGAGAGSDSGATTGGTGGSAGAAIGGSGGVATGGSGGVATGGSGGSALTSTDSCRVALTGATGSEPDGVIPVCCAPTAAEQVSIDELFALINDFRSANGATTLTYSMALQETAQGHSLHMESHSFFDDTAPETAVMNPWDRGDLCGARALGEVIGRGYTSAQSVIDGWGSTASITSLLLDVDWVLVGVGTYNNYWTASFGP